MTEHLVTCRYGKIYSVRLQGRNAEKIRTIRMLERCCCWVCYNRGCQQPKNEALPDCNTVCELFTRTPYCQRDENEQAKADPGEL